MAVNSILPFDLESKAFQPICPFNPAVINQFIQSAILHRSETVHDIIKVS